MITFDDDRVGILVDGEQIVDVSDAVDGRSPAGGRMAALIADWDELAPRVGELTAGGGRRRPVGDVTLHAPLRPGKIIAAPVNYRDHTKEMVELVGEQLIERFKGFLKAPSSIIGHRGQVRLPLAGRRTDYEGELAVVIGRDARGVAAQDALEYVFGYVPLLDMTIRGDEDRSFRKSADTFTPLGPAIVTSDEVGDPRDLRIRLWLNGELRQDAPTAAMVWDVPTLIERYSEIMTLAAGDVIATGTPAGIGEVVAGDAIRLEIDRVGTLEVTVTDELGDG